MKRQYGILKNENKLDINKVLDFAGILSFSVQDTVEVMNIILNKHNVTDLANFDFVTAYENHGNRWDEEELVDDLNCWEEDLNKVVTMENLYSVIEKHKNLYVLKSGLIVGYGY